MILIDPQTVMVMIILGELIIAGGLFTLARGRLGETDALARWAAATLTHGAGWAFFGLLRGVIPDVVSILVGNALLVLSLGLYLTIVAELSDKRISIKWTIGLVILQSLVLTYFTLVTPHLAARIVVASACGAALMLTAGWVLVSGRPDRPVSDSLTAAMFLGNGALLLTRFLYFLFWNTDPLQSPMARGPGDSVMYASFFITGIVLHFGFLMMLNDRHARGRAEAIAGLETVVQEKEALLKEAHHRVKNNLQLVTSLMRLRAADSRQPETKNVLSDMRAKVQSVILLNETLYRTGSYSQVDIASYLSQVATHLVGVHSPAPGATRLVLDLAPVDLETRQVIPCGLIVNELVTNSLKHAFPDGAGEVRIGVKREPDGRVRLEISDSGPGLPADLEQRREKSLGLQLVSDLVGQLKGTMAVSAPACFSILFMPSSDGSGGHAIPPRKG